MTARGCRSVCVLLAALLVPTAGVVTAGRQAASAKPTIIDFNVVGADGQPVLDLTAKDVALKVGGRTREISSFRLVRPEPSPTPQSLPPPFATNIRMGAGQCALRLEHFHEAGAAGRAMQGNAYVIYAPELTAAGSPAASAARGSRRWLAR